MSFFADMVAHDGQMAFEKCGDVVVSPKDNKLALFCHFCKDLITHLPQFLRHLHEAHGDVFHFTKEHNVFTVEELLSDEEEAVEDQEAEKVENNSLGEDCEMAQDQDDVKVEDNCQGGNGEIEQDQDAVKDENNTQGEVCGMPQDQENDEVINNNQDENCGTAQVTAKMEQCDESKVTPEIDLPDEMAEETPGSSRDVLAEVEAMLLSDEEVEENQEISQQDLAIKAYMDFCQGMQEKKQVSRPKTESESQRSKVGRNRKEVGLKISRLRSHAIARQSRKRMSTVKKRILRAIDNFVPMKQITLKNNLDNQEWADEQAQTLPLAPIRPRIPLSNTPSRPPMNAGLLSVRKSTLTTARISLQMTTTTTTTTSSETVVSCSNDQEVSSHIESCTNEDEASGQENKPFNLPNKSGNQSSHKSSPIKIQKIEILPKINIQEESSNLDDIDIEQELAVLLEERPVGSPMRRNSKENKEIPAKVKNSRTNIQKLNKKGVKSYITNRTQLETTNVENKLDILLAGIDSLKKTPKKSASSTSSTSTGESESIEVLIDNCTLLKYVGLPVINNPSYEDTIMLDELEDLRAKAVKFCKIFREYEEIWNCRKTKPMANDPQHLAVLIELLTQDLNAALDCQLSKTDAKRILNLITLWFWHTVDLKHFRKVALSSSSQHYFNLFAFIPQLTRFLFFCEYCDENFTLEAAYRKHLMSHSFTIRCAICRRAFKGHGFLDKHLRTLHANVNVLEYI